MAKLCCSVEMEPRTLKPGQMSHAREVAVGIFQNTEPAKGSNVLIIQGNGPVISMENMAGRSIERSQCCSCANPGTDEPLDHGGKLRGPHTAPF